MSYPSYPLEMEVRVTDHRLREWGIPQYQTEMAAGIDLFACVDEPLVLKPQAPAVLIPSGIAISMNNPFVAAMILPRSSSGHKKGLVLGNGTGLIDADYQNTIFISAWNRNPPQSGPDIVINPGERIAQMIFTRIERPTFTIVDEFTSSTKRGLGGFGSTGA